MGEVEWGEICGERENAKCYMLREIWSLVKGGGGGNEKNGEGSNIGGRKERFVLEAWCPRGGPIPPVIRSLMVDVKDRGWVIEVLNPGDRADEVRKSQLGVYCPGGEY